MIRLYREDPEPLLRALKKGVETALYHAVMDTARSLGLESVETVFRTDQDSAAPFYAKRGFTKWYGRHVMRCGGQGQYPRDPRVVPYEDRFFEQYTQAMQKSFYEMRRANDFKPYECVNFTRQHAQELLNDKSNIYVLLIEGNVAAASAVPVGSTDALGPGLSRQGMRNRHGAGCHERGDSTHHAGCSGVESAGGKPVHQAGLWDHPNHKQPQADERVSVLQISRFAQAQVKREQPPSAAPFLCAVVLQSPNRVYSGVPTPASRAAARLFTSQAMLRPSVRIMRIPSSSCRTSWGVLPCTMHQ